MKKLALRLAGVVATFGFASVAFAETATAGATATGDHSLAAAGLAIGSGIGIGLAAFGGALGQGKAAAATLEGIARNPEAAGKLLTPMIIALALIESLVIYALVIAFLLQGKI